MKIETPFTPEQVEALKQFQDMKMFHPFTCCTHNTTTCKRHLANEDRMNGKEVPYTDENEGVLIPTENGWVCPCGDYTQNWAHDFMSEKVKL